MTERFTMIFHKYWISFFILEALAVVSCNTLPGDSLYVGYFPQGCDSIIVSDAPSDEFSFKIHVKGDETEHDEYIESLAKDWLYRNHPHLKSVPGGSALVAIRYTTCLCTDIKIMLQGKNITDYCFIRNPGNSMCWFNCEKQIINIDDSEITISSFLGLSPLVPVDFEVFSKQLKKEDMEEQAIIVDMRINNDTTLSDEWIYEPISE